MKEVEKWRKTFLEQYGEVRDSFKTFEDSNERITSIFLSTKFKNGISENTGGVLIDIGCNIKNSDIVFTAASFSKGGDSIRINSHLLTFEPSSKSPLFSSIFSKLSVKSCVNQSIIRMKGRQDKYGESVNGFIKYKTENNIFELVDFEIQLLFWGYGNESFFPVKTWNIKDYKSEKFNLLCNNCFGHGSYREMSIPQADRDLGLSGYELYSCNSINGTYGCKICGGHGAKYEKWYLDENPKLKESDSQLVVGSGFVENSPNSTKINLKTKM